MRADMIATKDGVRGPLTAGIVVLTAFFGGIAGWAAQAPLAGAVVADGQLTVQGERKTVQHIEGGVIDEILVEEGALVRAGQPLVRLDTTEVRATRAALVAERDALAARAARLVAERDELDAPVYGGLRQLGGASLEAAIRSQNACSRPDARSGMLRSACSRAHARV
jgi:multidrug efflux pump subunit AcrA (membrane-fusion protein)